MLFDVLLVGFAVLLNGRTAAAIDGTPCQSVSSMSVAYASLYPSATRIMVPAQAAADCLKSVPVNVEEDKALIEEMQLYLNWQSNLAYLSNPPEGYNEERKDVIGEVKKIADDLDKGVYKDEHTLMFDLSMVLTKSYDFHLAFFADILQVFGFRRGNIGKGLEDEFAIVSVSSDGKALPELYNYYDIINAQEGSTPSPITVINNQSAEEYVQKWSEQFTFHEDHARYNRLFPNQALASMGTAINQFGRSTTPDGDYTTVEHKDGTIKQYINVATIAPDSLDGIESGEDFFAQFCDLDPPEIPSKKRDLTLAPKPNRKRGEILRDELMRKHQETTKVKRQAAQPTATGFPTPQILHSESSIGGYYLSGSGYDDVAVLSIPSFQPVTAEGPAEFQDLVGIFLKESSAAGKKKLVIDLRGNTGGRVFLGYDLFKQLFPSMDPYGASQFRANEAFDVTGQLMTEALKDISYEDALDDFAKNGIDVNGIAFAYQSIFNYKLPLTTENKNFTSWQEYFGPHERNNDKFTSTARLDLNNFFSDDLSLDVTGYRTRANLLESKQPFEANNIVLLQDGSCGSTCAVFSEFMKFQGGVQQVAVGGKPETGPMQGVAGSKGSQVFTWTRVNGEATRAYNFLNVNQEELNKTEMGELVHAVRPLRRSFYQPTGETASSINLRDNIRMNDTNATPLEFVYEAADCRLFYTAEMVRDTEAVWKKTVDGRWGDKKKVCVEGSTEEKTSLSGGAPTAAPGGGKKNAATRLDGIGAMMAVFTTVVTLFVML